MTVSPIYQLSYEAGLLGSSLFVSFALLFAIFCRRDSWNKRLVASAVSGAALVTFTLYLGFVANSVHNFWNAGRLVWAFSYVAGYEPYYVRGEGPLLSRIYGPLSFLVYLPVTIFRTPTWAIMAGSALTSAFFFLPAVLIFWLSTKEISRTCSRMMRLMMVLFALICFVFVALKSGVLLYSAMQVHADASSLGFAALACAILWLGDDGKKHFLASSIFCWAAFWAKQTSAPILVVVPLYVLLIYGWSSFLRFLKYEVVSGLGFTFLWVALCGFSELYYSAFVVPALHPWFGPKSFETLKTVFGELFDLTRFQLAGVMALLFLSALQHAHGNDEWKFRNWFRANPWILLLTVAFFMVPTSLLGRAKLGGDINTYGPTIYFLDLSLVFGAALTIWRINTSVVKFIPAILLLGYSCYAICRVRGALWNSIRYYYLNDHEVAFNFAKKYPGTAYFPDNPLSSLLAEGRLYHFQYGIRDAEWAGHQPSDEYFRKYLPENIKYVAYPPNNQGKLDRAYLPELTERVFTSELSQWDIYARPAISKK